jgi:hypothetical protein
MTRGEIVYKRQSLYLTADDVAIATGMTRDDLQKAIREGVFPPPSPNLKPGQLLWTADDVEDFRAKRWLRRSIVS